MSDVQNSTSAIKSGLYKAVNIIGVSVITSVRNAVKPIAVPYIFGGDGANLCVPDICLDKVSCALIATRQMAKSQFGLTLRVGIIPVVEIKKNEHKVLVSRHRMSQYYVQAAFAGGGMEYAESLIKDKTIGHKYQLDEDLLQEGADFSGLECRWDHVDSQHGETIALIVKVLAKNIEEEVKTYNEIINKIIEIYGNDEVCRPVQPNNLNFTYSNKKLSYEVKVRAFRKGIKKFISHWLLIRLQNILGWMFMKYDMNVGNVLWGDYKKDFVQNTDFKKFDGILREVISGNDKQRQKLENYLRQRYENGDCVYGINVSDSALVTCMINNRSGEHFHFVDGADGGYTMAAIKMKEQLKHNSSRLLS